MYWTKFCSISFKTSSSEKLQAAHLVQMHLSHTRHLDGRRRGVIHRLEDVEGLYKPLIPDDGKVCNVSYRADSES